MKGIWKNLSTPSKDQAGESWELKIEKRCKPKGYIIYSTNNNRKFPKYQKFYLFRYREPPEHQTELNKIEPLHSILSLKQQSTENKERILKALREKKQITCKGKSIEITADFSMETLKARRAWSKVF
jgi:hypothetical protein